MINELTQAIKTLGEKHRKQVGNFFSPNSTSSKVDMDYYTQNMANPNIGALDELDNFYTMSNTNENDASTKNYPRDFFFANAVTMQNQRVKRIKEIRNTIFSVLSQAAGQGVFHMNSAVLNTTTLVNLLLGKPSQTGVLFGDVFINDREFLATNKDKINSPGSVEFYRVLTEKAEEAKDLRLQHIRYYYDWNKLVNIVFEESKYDIASRDNQELIQSLDNAMEARLVGLQRKLVMIKLESISSLTLQHAAKARQLFNVRMVERISRRILVGVHQLFDVTEHDLMMQRKIADCVRRNFRFDDNSLKSTQYCESWNEYFTKIANGYVPIAGGFSEVHSRISGSLKATVELRLLKDRQLRCSLIRNVSVPLLGHSDDDDDVVADDHTNPYITSFFSFIDCYFHSFLTFLENLPSSFFNTFENVISFLSFTVSKILPTVKNFRTLSTFSTLMMINFDKTFNKYMEHATVFVNQVFDSIQQEMKDLSVIFQEIFDRILENVQHLKLVVADKISALREFRSENITSRPGKYHIMAGALLGRLQLLKQSGLENLPGVINLLDDIKSLLLQTADQTVHHVNTVYDDVISKIKTVYESLMGRATIIVDRLADGCGFFLEDLTQYCVMVNEVAQKIVAKAFDMTSAMIIMLLDIYVSVSSSITDFYNGFCSIVNMIVDTIEQFMVRLPLNTAREVYHGLPQDIQRGMCEIGNLVIGLPFVFVAIFYVFLFATCL